MLNDFNWNLEDERHAHRPPAESDRLRDTWKLVHLAIERLDGMTGVRGIYGLAGYADLDEI